MGRVVNTTPRPRYPPPNRETVLVQEARWARAITTTITITTIIKVVTDGSHH